MTMNLFEMQVFDPLAEISQSNNKEDLKEKLKLKRKLPDIETADKETQKRFLL